MIHNLNTIDIICKYKMLCVVCKKRGMHRNFWMQSCVHIYDIHTYLLMRGFIYRRSNCYLVAVRFHDCLCSHTNLISSFCEPKPKYQISQVHFPCIHQSAKAYKMWSTHIWIPKFMIISVTVHCPRTILTKSTKITHDNTQNNKWWPQWVTIKMLRELTQKYK